MSLWLRTALIWLVAAALPLQGWAAATMAGCGPAHHRMAQSANVPADRHADADPAHRFTEAEAEAANRHADDEAQSADGFSRHDPAMHALAVAAADHHAAPDTEAAPTHDGQDSHDAHQLHKAAKSKCSACGSCCAAAALIAALPQVVIPQLLGFAAPIGALTAAVFVTGGPDRPPRADLA